MSIVHWLAAILATALMVCLYVINGQRQTIQDQQMDIALLRSDLETLQKQGEALTRANRKRTRAYKEAADVAQKRLDAAGKAPGGWSSDALPDECVRLFGTCPGATGLSGGATGGLDAGDTGTSMGAQD